MSLLRRNLPGALPAVLLAMSCFQAPMPCPPSPENMVCAALPATRRGRCSTTLGRSSKTTATN